MRGRLSQQRICGIKHGHRRVVRADGGAFPVLDHSDNSVPIGLPGLAALQVPQVTSTWPYWERARPRQSQIPQLTFNWPGSHG